MGSTTTISVNRLRLFCQTIKILDTISLNSNTISLLPSSLNKTISFTTGTINDRSVFDQTNIIYNTKPLHFLTLSLFFLPLTITIHLASADVTTIFHNLITLFIVIVFTVIGVATITYSTYTTIFRTPLTLASTFNSLSSSFIPLLSTFITLISLSITLLSLWFRFDIIRISSDLVIAIFIFFYVVTLGLAPAIAVLELKSGFRTLRECVKNQSVMVWFEFYKLVIYTVLTIGGNLGYCAAIKNKDSVSAWVLFVVVSVIHLQASLMMVHHVVATTVLYVRAKAAHGGYVVVKTRMRVFREDRRVPMLGWYSDTMAISYLIIFLGYLI